MHKNYDEFHSIKKGYRVEISLAEPHGMCKAKFPPELALISNFRQTVAKIQIDCRAFWTYNDNPFKNLAQ